MAGFINIKVHQDILYQWLRYDAGRGIKLYRGLQVAQLKTVSPVPGLIDRANQVLSGIIVNHHITGRQLPDAIIRQPLTSENIKFRPIQGTKTTIYLILIGYLIPSCHFPHFHFLAQGDFF
ncbi:hypothetical protein P5V13_27450 [Klebsiella pneumoniae]|nr:hypothetical protein [Klebsiella pneumoniae]